jgi:predicted transcriptional regulator
VLKQGDLENIILNALWDLEHEQIHPVFVSHIQDRIRQISKRWAYTTVKTVLDRLVEKDLAVREKHGKKFSYQSQLKREDAGLMAIEKVMRQYFQNDLTAFTACVNKVKLQSSHVPVVGLPGSQSNSSSSVSA